MKISAISDLHGCVKLKDLDIDGEILCIAGDISPLEIQRNTHKVKNWFINKFIPALEQLPVKKVFLVVGNHDFLFEIYHPTDNDKIVYLDKSEYLYQSEDGNTYKIYGIPNVQYCGNWAFSTGEEELNKCFDDIPEDTDILITHQPPALADIGTVLEDGDNIPLGNRYLYEQMLAKNTRLSLCGHIHSGNHNLVHDHNLYATNVSLLDEKYELHYPVCKLNVTKENVSFRP